MTKRIAAPNDLGDGRPLQAEERTEHSEDLEGSRLASLTGHNTSIRLNSSNMTIADDMPPGRRHTIPFEGELQLEFSEDYLNKLDLSQGLETRRKLGVFKEALLKCEESVKFVIIDFFLVANHDSKIPFREFSSQVNKGNQAFINIESYVPDDVKAEGTEFSTKYFRPSSKDDHTFHKRQKRWGRIKSLSYST